MTFGEPNVVILIRKNSLLSFPLVGNPSELSESVKKDCGQAAMTDKIKFGLSETEIIHSRGLITKNEVRAVTIHKLSLPQRGVLWDIGAGSGSVSIEAARLYPELKVFAVEKDEEQIRNIKENRTKFDATNIEIIKGQAPDVLINLPVPDRVFIGGSGGAIKEIIEFVSSKISSGIVVINAITIETLNEAIKSLENKGFVVEVSEISVSRSKNCIGQTAHERLKSCIYNHRDKTVMRGKLYAIGVGPGDPELLTLKALRILKGVPCICVPKGREEGSSLALSIVQERSEP